MQRKITKEAHDFVIKTIREKGSMPTEEVIEPVRGHYVFDPQAALKRELRRYVGRIARRQRDSDGTRRMFLETKSAHIVDIERCTDVEKVTAVNAQLRVQAVGLLRSCRKAANRKRELKGQMTFIDDQEFLSDLMDHRHKALS
jgi:hypothetical protein